MGSTAQPQPDEANLLRAVRAWADAVGRAGSLDIGANGLAAVAQSLALIGPQAAWRVLSGLENKAGDGPGLPTGGRLELLAGLGALAEQAGSPGCAEAAIVVSGIDSMARLSLLARVSARSETVRLLVDEAKKDQAKLALASGRPGHLFSQSNQSG